MLYREWWRGAEVRERQVRHSKREGIGEGCQRMPGMRKTKTKKKNRRKEEHWANSVLAMPNLSPSRAKSSIVGRTYWLCYPPGLHLSKRNSIDFCFITCRKMESPRGQYLDLCRLVYMLLEHTELLCITRPQRSPVWISRNPTKTKPVSY